MVENVTVSVVGGRFVERRGLLLRLHCKVVGNRRRAGWRVGSGTK